MLHKVRGFSLSITGTNQILLIRMLYSSTYPSKVSSKELLISCFWKKLDFRIRTIQTRALSFCLHFDETHGSMKTQTLEQHSVFFQCFEIWISRCTIPQTARKVVTVGERPSRGTARPPTRQTCTEWLWNSWDHPQNIQGSLCKKRQGHFSSAKWSNARLTFSNLVVIAFMVTYSKSDFDAWLG